MAARKKVLPEDQLRELVGGYAAGTSLKVLAQEKGMVKGTVRRLLAEAGQSIRKKGRPKGVTNG